MTTYHLVISASDAHGHIAPRETGPIAAPNDLAAAMTVRGIVNRLMASQHATTVDASAFAAADSAPTADSIATNVYLNVARLEVQTGPAYPLLAGMANVTQVRHSSRAKLCRAAKGSCVAQGLMVL